MRAVHRVGIHGGRGTALLAPVASAHEGGTGARGRGGVSMALTARDCGRPCVTDSATRHRNRVGASVGRVSVNKVVDCANGDTQAH